MTTEEHGLFILASMDVTVTSMDINLTLCQSMTQTGAKPDDCEPQSG